MAPGGAAGDRRQAPVLVAGGPGVLGGLRPGPPVAGPRDPPVSTAVSAGSNLRSTLGPKEFETVYGHAALATDVGRNVGPSGSVLPASPHESFKFTAADVELDRERRPVCLGIRRRADGAEGFSA